MAKNKIKSDTDQRPFTLVYDDFLRSKALTYYEKIIFIALKSFTNEKAKSLKAFPSMKQLHQITGISRSKIQEIISSLENKSVINVERREDKTNGGKESNLYTLYDYASMWTAEDGKGISTAVEMEEEKRMIEVLTAKGYHISKEKGLESHTDQSEDTNALNSQNKYPIDTDNSTSKAKCQAERYSVEDIKGLYDYESLIIQYPNQQTDIDIVFDILYDTLNSTKKTIRIGSEDKPLMVVIGKLMKLQSDDLIYSIEKYHEQTDRIRNAKSYLLTILYNSREQQHLDLMNKGHHNGDF